MERDGYVLPEGTPAPRERLVVLKGVERVQAPLKPGQQKKGEAMERALRLLERLQRAPELAGHRVSALDVGDPDQLLFVMDDDVEVRCGGEEDLSMHLHRLREVLKQIASHSLAVRYIDVRFQDPVIAPKT